MKLYGTTKNLLPFTSTLEYNDECSWKIIVDTHKQFNSFIEFHEKFYEYTMEFYKKLYDYTEERKCMYIEVHDTSNGIFEITVSDYGFSGDCFSTAYEYFFKNLFDTFNDFYYYYYEIIDEYWY